MNLDKPKILVVEDLAINRQLLNTILSKDYTVIEADNGLSAFSLVESEPDISAILLDIVMPVMDGYAFLEKLHASRFDSLPVIVVTGDNDSGTEQKALNLGAWDFVSKPYQPAILLLRLKNAIIRSKYYLLSEMQYAYAYDPLTGLYNRTQFFSETRLMLDRNPGIRFAMVRLDIDHFHVLNSFWGEEEGNRFLKFIASLISRDAQRLEPSTFARISADAFAVCEPYDKDAIDSQVKTECVELSAFNINFRIKPSFGIYVIDDPQMNIQKMYELSTLAAKQCKGSYNDYICYYSPELSHKAAQEQEIVNEMQHALDDGQFVVYLQPKYNLRTGRPYGAEALVRWQHPERGLLPPGKFIPVFERNGFIDKVDFYMWDKVCAILRGWLDRGLDPAPISVNVSRVDMYNPNLVDVFSGLVKKYDIPPALLNLELTESAYMDNPDVMCNTVKQLRSAGFTVMMDDFGSGYSSLNTLKDIPIDVIKIDMKFLSGTADPSRRECIMSCIIHMAVWLNIPVIMEGVETREQVDFLRSIGCDYVQGYYFARPMPVDEYEKLTDGVEQLPIPYEGMDDDGLLHCIWWSDPCTEKLFNPFSTPAAVFEYRDGAFSAVRVNSGYNKFFGYGDNSSYGSDNIIRLGEAAAKVLGPQPDNAGGGEDIVLEYAARLPGRDNETTVRACLKHVGNIGGACVYFIQFS